jgi:transcriptional regulator with XRE-family HTH domain
VLLSTDGKEIVVILAPGRVRTLVFMGEHTPGSRLRELRERLHLSLRQAAQRAETISYATIRQLEHRVGAWDRVEVGTLSALSRAYGVPLDRLVRLVFLAEDTPDIAEEVIKKPEDLEVHPEWVAFRAVPASEAGAVGAATPSEGKVAYIPKEHLVRAGAKVDNVRVFHLDGECLVSEEAQRVSKSFVVGDYVAIDSDREPEPGEVVASWCEVTNAMVFLRWGIDVGETTLRALSKRREPPVVGNAQNTRLLGPVIWRGG